MKNHSRDDQSEEQGEKKTEMFFKIDLKDFHGMFMIDFSSEFLSFEQIGYIDIDLAKSMEYIDDENQTNK